MASIAVDKAALRGFRTGRFLVRPFQAGDYARWKAAYLAQFPKQNEFDEDPKRARELTRLEFAKMLRKHRRFRQDRVIYWYAVVERKTGRLVGQVLLALVERYNVQSARISYFIFNNYWKHGFGHEVADGVVEFAFRRLKLHRLDAEILPGNRASVALARRIGMQPEGVRRRAVYVKGRWRDHLIWAITAEDRGIVMRPLVF
ncbi:MAG: GNAT family N-acetyltransferase [Bdellovibrionales bacterium]|nr:GNAT family N-acetyltransferase [Bdellovibrionales bacterium]